jgi:hypothetical protein
VGLGIVVWRFWGGRAMGCIAYSVSKSVVVYGYSNHEYFHVKTFFLIEQFDKSCELWFQVFEPPTNTFCFPLFYILITSLDPSLYEPHTSFLAALSQSGRFVTECRLRYALAMGAQGDHGDYGC